MTTVVYSDERIRKMMRNVTHDILWWVGEGMTFADAVARVKSQTLGPKTYVDQAVQAAADKAEKVTG